MSLPSAIDTIGHVATAIDLLKPVIGTVADYIAGHDVSLPELPGTLRSEIELARLKARSRT